MTQEEINKVHRDETASFAAKVSFPNPETLDDNKLPPVSVYGLCLDEICKCDEIDRETARNKYGLLTWGQWKELINSHRVKNNDKVLH